MEQNKNTDGFITDDMRLRAETKQVTIDPLHQDVKAEDIPDSEIAAHHLASGPIANALNDIEQTEPSPVASSAAQEQAPSGQSKAAIIIGIFVICGVSTAALFWLTA